MSRTVTKGILAGIVALALPMGSWAAGLGRLTVQSPLGQPLNAEIEIVSVQPGEEEGLTARLPSNEAFKQAGIELNPALLSLRFAIEQRDGRPVVRLTTTQPVNEPFLDLLVELQWNTGRLVREYTFLLDPPEYRSRTAIAGAPAPAEKPAAPRAEAPAPTQEKPQPSAAARAATPDAQTYEVKPGDTLAGIARQHLPAGVSLEQMLAAIYNANRDAFIAENINLVRSGQILNIPGAEAASSVASDEARQLVDSHAANFSEYRKRVAAAPTPAEAAPGQRESAGRIEAKPPVAPPSAAQDQLRLSKAEPGKPAAAGARAAQEDDRVARERALSEAQSRVTELEKNVADLQKLLELRNQQLAELEKRAKGATAVPVPAKPEAAKPAPEAPKPAAEAPKPAAEAPKPAAEAPKPAAEARKPAAEAPKPAAEAPKPAAEAPKPAAEAPKPAAKPSPEFKSTKARPKPTAQEPSLLDELLNPYVLGGLLLVVLLLVAYGVFAWRRKKAGQARFQDSVLGAASAPAAAAAAAAAAPAAPVSSQISSQSPLAGMEPEEVDPIAEADVYMAYGRDSQAEEILKEALQKDPNRAAIHAKLLEIYANRRDKAAFEQAALKLKGLTNGSGPEWEKAAALGRSVDPQNGLYGGASTTAPGAAAAAAAAAAAPAAPSLDFDLGGGTTQEATLPDIPLDEAKAPAVGSAIDFDLGAATGETHQKAADKTTDFTPEGTLIMGGEKASESALSGLDFDLDLSTPEEKKAQQSAASGAAPSAPAAPASASQSMDFDLNLDLGAEEPKKPAEAPGQGAPLDLSSIDLDLSEPAGASGGAGADPKWQEVATKLDLAKAYEEMGDKDGARELLAEVVREGDAAQKGEAEQMLAKLG